MTLFSMCIIGVALAMDAFAVSIASGVYLKSFDFRQAFRLSWHFGFFQAMMPVIGWSAGFTVRRLIEAYDHWVAFFLLAFVGSNMIREAFQKKDASRRLKDPTRGSSLVLLSVATSTDALAVGLGISVLNISIWMPAMVIGITAFLFSAIGFYIGTEFRKIATLGKIAEIAGGIILFLIGINILHRHCVF